MQLRTIIIDNELDAIEAIENILINDCTDIEIIAKINDPRKAIDVIKQEKPDFIFLDIEMPRMNGFEMLGELKDINFEIVFVTAYNDYAIEAIKANALDYILKPVDIEELKLSISKVREKRELNLSKTNNYQNIFENINKSALRKVKITTANGFEIVDTKDVIRIEASGSYSVIILRTGEQIVVSKSIKDMDETFISFGFFRSHRSHIINMIYVKRFITENDGEIIMEDNSRVPLSRRRRTDFNQALDSVIL